MDNEKKKIIEALVLSNGIVTTACESIGLARSTYYDWLKSDDEFKDAVSDVQEIAVDVVESELYKRIKAGDTTAIIFFLKTKAKRRGYVERQELTGADGSVLLNFSTVPSVKPLYETKGDTQQ